MCENSADPLLAHDDSIYYCQPNDNLKHATTTSTATATTLLTALISYVDYAATNNIKSEARTAV